jgi:hypothetical protein
MEWIYNKQLVDECWNKWIRLGWAGSGDPFKGFVDPEKLIVGTTHIGRYEGRLFKAMITWIRDFHDLINVQRLLHFTGDADLAVLGAAFDIAIRNGADHRLHTVLKHCEPYSEPQVLFKQEDEFGVYSENQKEFGRKEYLKWGLYGTMIEFYDDAMLDRKNVLKKNPLLALRALIGPNIRSEILFELEHVARIHIRALAQKIGYAYSAVYNEVMNMANNGFLTVEVCGRNRVLTMRDTMSVFLSKIPVM